MTNTKEIQKKLEKLYERKGPATVDIPLELQAKELGSFARDYIAAASILEREASQHWLPLMQLTGHAVELSLKACLASANSDPPISHDLIKLYRKVEKLGFKLDGPKFAAIVHLQHFYFEDLSTRTKHKARYPTKQNESLGGSVPSNSTFTSIVDSLLDQAEQRGAN